MSEQTTSPFNRINRQLADYLDKKSNNAILLTANWGAGKTHYIKKVFFDIIKEKGYKKAYISLFGVNSVDDIKERIFLEIYPLLGNKFLKTGTTLFKALLKSIDVTKFMTANGLVASSLDNVGEIGSALKEISKESIDLEKLVVCFDDLERIKSDLLSENQVLGYINSLVEDDNIKVVIIAYEAEIKDAQYEVIKEKVIANTIHFSQEFSETFDSILHEMKSVQNEKYLNHLRTAAPLIGKFLLKQNGVDINYRTLSYFLAYYEPIWRAVQIGTGVADLDEKKSEIQEYLLKFSLFICVEFKKGAITYRKPAGLEAGIDFHVRRVMNENLKPSEHKVDQLIQSYFEKEDYIFYKSIFDYLTGGDYFNSERLIEELCVNYRVQNQNISPSYKVFNKLAAIKQHQFSDQEYTKLVRELKDYALKGFFFTRDYITVFYYIFRFGNVLRLNKQLFVKNLCKAILKTVSWQAYEPMLHYHFSNPPEGEFYNEYDKIYEATKEVNIRAKQLEIRTATNVIEQKLKHNFDELYKTILGDYQAQKRPTISLCGTRAQVFFQAFKKASNKQKNEMNWIIRILFEHFYGELEDEKMFLDELNRLNNDYVARYKPKNISGNLHSELSEHLEEYITMRV